MEDINIFLRDLAVVFATVGMCKLRGNRMRLPSFITDDIISVRSPSQSRFNPQCPGRFIVALNVTKHTSLGVCERIFA
jgi:hypothetical protein